MIADKKNWPTGTISSFIRVIRGYIFQRSIDTEFATGSVRTLEYSVIPSSP